MGSGRALAAELAIAQPARPTLRRAGGFRLWQLSLFPRAGQGLLRRNLEILVSAVAPAPAAVALHCIPRVLPGPCALVAECEGFALSKDSDQQPRTDGETVLLGTSRARDERHEACLVIIRGARLGSRIVPGDEPLVIGRAVEADFQIAERSISRQHCRIFRENDRYWIEDMGSTNHTWLNDEKVERAPL